MPIYEFECPKCKTVTEIICRIDNEPPICVCGTKTVKLFPLIAHYKIDGSSPATKRYARELSKKGGERLAKQRRV